MEVGVEVDWEWKWVGVEVTGLVARRRMAPEEMDVSRISISIRGIKRPMLASPLGKQVLEGG